MNRDQMEGNWSQFTGKIREKWGQLTDDEIATFKGRRDQLVGRIQELYGDRREDIERQLDAWDGSRH